MDECLKLHKAMSEAEVEHQQKFDALKAFDDELLVSGTITNPEERIKERDRLEAEEQVALEKMNAVRKAYDERCKPKA